MSPSSHRRAKQHSDQTQRPATRSSPRASADRTSKVRYAVVGLGHIAQAAVLPAFAHASKNSELAALVTDDPDKRARLGKRYSVSALYDYSGLRRCLAEESIDAVYIATPNSEHAPIAIQAAQAGVHVLCEKPLGVTERECMAIIDACKRADVRLMTAYRLHFEAANLKTLELIKSGRIGEPRIFTSAFSYQIKDPQNIRLRRDLGGGPLHDIGIYCINAARSVFKAEPVQVHGWTLPGEDPRFDEVHPGVSAQLRFPGGQVASFVCSFAAAATGWYQVIGSKGDIRVDPAYEYTQGLELTVTVDDKSREHRYAQRDQFAAELVYFSECIRDRREPEPSGWEGLADVRVIRAIQQSIDRGRSLEIQPTPHARHPSPALQIDRPPVRKEPSLVQARSPS
ncbi:MAG: Gfo/Idh/MocA family protein [Phycisphaerales bacterium]